MPLRAYEQNCSIAHALEVVGERWTLLVMREILLGRRNFREIRRRTGIASNILSDRLSTLVEQGLLRKEGEEYAPTRKGVDINPVIVALMNWGDEYAAPNGPPRVVVHTKCGHDADPRLHCSHCGEELQPPETRVRPGPGADELQQRE
jgi:DNA-binding HxlR family transcriptional regulator